MTESMKGAVIVLFGPDADVVDKIKLYSSQVDFVLVYDNTPYDHIHGKVAIDELATIDNVCVVAEGNNVGVATALNVGVKKCIENGCSEIFLFDQDSRPSESSFFDNMSKELKDLNRRDQKIICLAPDIKDEASPTVNYKWLVNNNSVFFKRSSLKDNWDGSILVAITSGTLIYASAFKSVGFFLDDFFIDYVDTEYCLRLVNAGYKIQASRSGVLLHNLGARSEHKVLGHKFYPTNHSGLRRYYIARNSIYMWKWYALSNPNWAIFDLTASLYNALRIVCFESDKFGKIRSSMNGFYHGFIGRVGVKK